MTTNYERIKAMSIDEMTEMFYCLLSCSDLTCQFCPLVVLKVSSLCTFQTRMQLKAWLNNESEAANDR